MFHIVKLKQSFPQFPRNKDKQFLKCKSKYYFSIIFSVINYKHGYPTPFYELKISLATTANATSACIFPTKPGQPHVNV